MTTKAQLFHSSNHNKWLLYRILDSKPVKNDQIDPQTTEIWPKELFVNLYIFILTFQIKKKGCYHKFFIRKKDKRRERVREKFHV